VLLENEQGIIEISRQQ